MISIDEFTEGLFHYIKSEVLPGMPDYGKLLAGAALMRNARRAGDILRELTAGDALRIAGFIEDDNMIDIDAWAMYLKNSMEDFCGGKVCVKLPMLGSITFREADIDVLKRYCKSEY